MNNGSGINLSQLVAYLLCLATIVALTVGYVDLDKRIVKLEKEKPALYLVDKNGKTFLLKQVR